LLTIVSSPFYFGIWHFNNPSSTQYPIRGVDVSSYQGNIDWAVLSKQNISFAFIKATEGSSFVDKHFIQNWEEALKTSLWVGAYHFFSFESKGSAQAAHFISTVGSLQQSLPPVIDIEYYEVKSDKSFSRDKIRDELKTLIHELEKQYGVLPILYVTKETYKDFVKDNVFDCSLWVRNVLSRPGFVQDDAWTFWQYSNRHLLAGYSGVERYIDMNVYNGDLDQFMDQFSLQPK
jgi:lysozyme